MMGSERWSRNMVSWAERLLAREDMVVSDMPLDPPKYHFFIISTTFAFSTPIFESSFPSVLNTICPQKHTYTQVEN